MKTHKKLEQLGIDLASAVATENKGFVTVQIPGVRRKDGSSEETLLGKGRSLEIAFKRLATQIVANHKADNLVVRSKPEFPGSKAPALHA